MVSGSRNFSTARDAKADRPCQRCGIKVPYETVKRLLREGRPILCNNGCKTDRHYLAAMARKG